MGEYSREYILDGIEASPYLSINLTDEQKNAIATIFTTEKSFIHLTGEAGSGKTFTINSFREVARKMGKEVLLSATTGIAALLIDGQTLFQALGISVEMLKVGELLHEVPYRFLDSTYIVVDECSMLTAEVFNVLKSCMKDDQKVILTGDMSQLGPVLEEEKITMYTSYKSKLFAIVKEEMEIIKLSGNKRHTDNEFLDMLRRLRRGDFVPEINDRFLEEYDFTTGITSVMYKVARELVEGQKNNKSVYFIAESNAECREINAICQQLITTDPKDYRSYEPVFFKATNYNDFPEEIRTTVKKAVKSAQKEIKQIRKKDYPKLTLCIGQKVMITVNESVGAYRDRRYANGTEGIVVGLEEDMVKVKIRVGGEYEEVDIKNVTIKNKVRYTGVDGESHWYCYESVKYMPIIGANAITVHKSQGKTMEKVFWDPRGCEQPGQSYTAVSRARSIESLFLVAPATADNFKEDRHVHAFWNYYDRYEMGYLCVVNDYLERRFFEVDAYLKHADLVQAALKKGMTKMAEGLGKISFADEVESGDYKSIINNGILFNELYDLEDDVNDPRLPFAIAKGIENKDRGVLKDWIDGKYDDILDPVAYGLPYLEVPEIAMSKEEGAAFLGMPETLDNTLADKSDMSIDKDVEESEEELEDDMRREEVMFI